MSSVLRLVVLGLLSTVLGCSFSTGVGDDVGTSKLPLCAPGGPGPFACGDSCLCGVDQGGCANDADCEAGLMCRKDVGASVGLAADVNVCQPITNCKRFGAPYKAAFCTPGCPCGEDEGGCTYGDDSTCDTGLTCFHSRGPSIGLPTSINLCMAACPPFDSTLPNPNFCTEFQCPCGAGEGDCDKNSQCTTGICVSGVGASYGLPADYDVCGCPTFDVNNPSLSFCSAACPCPAGQGDCDNDAECQGALVCTDGVGATYGLPAAYGVCEDATVPVCHAFDVNNPSLNFCTPDCPCGEGEGGCSLTDASTCNGLPCRANRGPAIGLPANYHLCMAQCPAFDNSPSHQNPAFCSTECPCGLGEGDCDTDSECAQGVCVNDIGATYGLPADWDVCDCPVLNLAQPQANFCSTSCPCTLGEGDCDSDAECVSGLLCLREGGSYGLPTFYDVCTGPLLQALTTNTGTLSPTFSKVVYAYSIDVGVATNTITLTPTVNSGATLTVQGAAHTSGQPWVSPALSLGANQVNIVVSRGGVDTAYTVTVNRVGLEFVQEGYLKATDTEAGDEFGSSIAVSGDTVVVGAPLEDAGGADSGAAYVFVRVAGVWTAQGKLVASNAAAGDQFGQSVAISGDTIVVGADFQDTSGSDSGAAYVFTRSGGVWSQQANLKASNANVGDHFGSSVAITGNTLVVGAYSEDTGVVDSGSAYVFTRSGVVWTQRVNLKASNPGTGDRFGRSVALSGTSLVVGANGEDSSATGVDGNQADNGTADSGAAYVFTGSGAAWSQQAYLKANNTGADAGFGISVGIAGDTLVAGSYLENNVASNSGAAYVFTRSGSVWSQQAYLKASNPDATDRFGFAVAISGDDIVVGAQREDSNATGIGGDQTNNSSGNSGAAYTFTRSGSVWQQVAYIKASNTGPIQRFGWSVALDGVRLAIGARVENSNATGVNGDQANIAATGAGAAYVFR